MEDGFHNHMSDSTLVQNASCANCISRRAFVAKSALGAAATAAFLAACGDGVIGGFGPSGLLGQVQIKVSDFPGLAANGTFVIVDNLRTAKRTGVTTFLALDRRCTHESTPVDPSGSGFLCSNHGAMYDSNGVVTLGPAVRNLATLTSSYDAATDTLTIG